MHMALRPCLPHALNHCPISMPYAHALRPFSTPMPYALALHQCTTPLLRLCPTPMAYTHALRPTHPCPTLMGAPMPILPMPYAHDLRFMSIPPMPYTQALCQCATLNALRQPLRPSPLPMLYAHGTHIPYAHALRPCLHSAHCPCQQHRLGRKAWAEGQVKDMRRVSSNMYL